MHINTITVIYSRTESLGNYSNVKPGVTFTATLEPGDNHDRVMAHLWAEAQYQVHAQIDAALELDGSPPRFYEGPRFAVISSSPRQCAAVVPEGTARPGGRWISQRNSLRHETALALAFSLADLDAGWTVVDCADGDLSKLPPLPEPASGPLGQDKYDWRNDGDDEDEDEYDD